LSTCKVSFHKESERVVINIDKDKETVKMLEKTKEWKDVDMAAERARRVRFYIPQP